MNLSLFDSIAIFLVAKQLLWIFGARKEMFFIDVFGCVAIGALYYLCIRVIAWWPLSALGAPAFCVIPLALVVASAPLMGIACRMRVKEARRELELPRNEAEGD